MLRSVRRPVTQVRSVLAAVAVLALAVGIGGCAKIDATLGQQWIQVTFAPNTTIATARHITSVCSHVPNVRLEGPVKATSGQRGVVGLVNYDDTKANVAQQALLERCLSRFPATVQGFTQMDQGDS
jgi:hypothetical protein